MVILSKTTINYTQKVQELLPGSKIIKLHGYGSFNKQKDYSKAKTPIGKWLDAEAMTDEEINKWTEKGGWIGATLPEGRMIIDVDVESDGTLLKELLEGEGVHHHCIRTVRGWQFIFNATEERTSKIKQVSHFWSAIGIRIDTKPPTKGYIVFPTSATEGRHVVTQCMDGLSEVPTYLHPVWNAEKTKDYEFPIPIDGQGSRNSTLYEFARRLWTVKGNEVLLNTSIHLIYEYFVKDKQDFEIQEVETIIKSVMGREEQNTIQYSNDNGDLEQVTKASLSEIKNPVEIKVSNQKLNVEIDGKLSSIEIPLPFQVRGSSLFLEAEKKIDGILETIYIPVCRQVPVITRSFSNIEQSQLYYEISWTDNGREHTETVSAGDLAIKKDLLKLANLSLGVTDNNAKNLITYFDRFISYNNIPREHLVERLGHIKNGFIHPLNAEGVKILPSDIGEKQMLEAFEVSGTTDDWIANVFKPIKEHPKALLMVLSSFTSVILQDLKMKPFIIDLSGVTSQGKTTVLRACASVWGNEYLVSEWSLTRVALERKASFLNDFPILLDDTRKADPNQLKSFVYSFSGGRSKGRGSITGSQKEYTWSNLMLSTGEASLNSYAEGAGGVAARILPITGLPFEGESYQFFNDLYDSIEKYYGTIGLEFLEHWKDKKKTVLPFFDEYNVIFQKKALGNEVISRISRYYAAIVFTGRLLNEFFNLEIDLMQLFHLFDELNAENKSTDKPMQLLESILADLDSDRGSVYGEFLPLRGIKAIYKNKTLYLLPAYLKEFLKSEQNTIRSEWLRRSISIERMNNGSVTDHHQIKHKGKKFNGIAIQPEIVEKLGFDFEENQTIN